jgi:hypothetical protein
LFTSSIASTQSWDSSLGKYPEEHVEDVKYARGAGYGESKYVSERVSIQVHSHVSTQTKIYPNIAPPEKWAERNLVQDRSACWWSTRWGMGSVRLGANHCEVESCHRCFTG